MIRRLAFLCSEQVRWTVNIAERSHHLAALSPREFGIRLGKAARLITVERTPILTYKWESLQVSEHYALRF
jgi:hypothetical protein